MKKRIDEFLAASPRTKRVADLSFGEGRQLSIWRNSQDEVQYNATNEHAFSLYLSGGAGTYRVDGTLRQGTPGGLCILPQGHSSQWQITDTFQFVHLYVADHILRAAFAQTHDQDARRLNIDEKTFAPPEMLEAPLRKMAMATIDGDILAADESFSEMVAALVDKPINLTGGLSRKALRDVRAWVESHMESNIKLSDLAALAGLSEFHFHRMFKTSCGMSPHNWITQLRIKRAKEILTKQPLAQVSVACGFSSQSHFTRRFKEQTGVTPGAYRRMTAS
ncbi:MAG: AraC family transcriptional regulator [Pseudoruegeria sp.]